MHSPFVFDFILHVLNNKKKLYPPKQIENLRQQLLKDNRLLTIRDLGAGSAKTSSPQRSVRSIARSALKSKKLAQVLFRLVHHYRAKQIVELGTSLGITTSYL